MTDRRRDNFICDAFEVMGKIDSEAKKSSSIISFAGRCFVLLRDIRALLREYEDINPHHKGDKV